MAAKNTETMIFPETLDTILREKDGEKHSGFMGPKQDGTFIVFFTYEGPDDRFVYGFKKNLTQEQASQHLEKERTRLNPPAEEKTNGMG